METIDVGIGEVCIGRAPAVLRTNLGSCVAVILYDYELKWGGIAHIVSPESIQSLNKVTTSYADIAIPSLLEQLADKGCKKNRYICSIAGGGCMFGGMSEAMDIGRKNIEAVRAILSKERIAISKSDVGGNYSTIVVFNTVDGSVELERRLSDLQVVIKKEKDFQKQWMDQSTELLIKMEDYLKSKQNEYTDRSNGKINSERLLNIIRLYSAMNNVGRLIGYLAYHNICIRQAK